MNRNAGIKLPIIPEVNKKTEFSFVKLLRLRIANGSKIMNPRNIRIAATCTSENASIPFFIRMKEPPQINANSSMAAHCQRFFDKLNIV